MAPFQNIGAIKVLIEDLGEDGKKADISKEELQAFVELKLRQNGIPVQKAKEFALESPCIYIKLKPPGSGTTWHRACG